MNNTQVAEAFAKGATKGKSGNVFIDGDTIYSYGYHFPMASRVDGIVYVTYREYSSSTARQLSYVRRALNNDYIEVYNPTDGAMIADMHYWNDKRSQYLSKKNKARTESSKNVWDDMAGTASIQRDRIEALLLK